MTSQKFQYRPEIDGLRAIAVLAVLFSHAEFGFASGGFVGVDVFFVISGYLITSIIWAQIESGSFTIVGFYERRARRIFPALFVVILICVVTSYILLLPTEFRDFAQSVSAAAVFASNLLFWYEAGYFDAESLLKPLLHTWSLAVEEQYYLIFPLMLVGINSWRSRWVTAIIIVLLLSSLVFSISTIDTSPSATFYLLPARFWELMLGAFIALAAIPVIRNRWLAETVAILGLLMIAGAIFWFDSTTKFPGASALLPCVGTVLVMQGTERSSGFVKDLLASRPFVFVGLISYSLYLWHWPILVFARMYSENPWSSRAATICILIALVCSYLSYKFVETPLRNRSFLSRKTILVSSLILIFALFSIGASIHALKGVRQRFDPDVLRIVTVLDEDKHSRGCLISQKDVESMAKLSGRCSSGPEPHYLLWGDSHAGSIGSGLEALEGDFILLAMHDCPPLINTDTNYGSNVGPMFCRRFNDQVLDWITTQSDVDAVVLSAFWSIYTEGFRLPSDPDPRQIWVTDETGDPNAAVMRRSLDALAGELQNAGIDLIIIGPIPEIEINGATSLARRKISRRSGEIRPTTDSVRTRIKNSIDLLRNVADDNANTSFFRVDVPLCESEFCEVELEGSPLYVDRHHLSDLGARLVIRKSGISEALP